MEKQKRERSVNFTPEETDILLSLAMAKKHIIENKKSDANVWQDKEKAWKDIEIAFNASFGTGSIFRGSKHLKSKYEAIKRDTRKKSAAIRANKTGDGTSTAPVLTPAEEKVKEMILLSEDNESCIDSDGVLPCASIYETSCLPVQEQEIVPDPEQTLNNGETDSTTHGNNQYVQWMKWSPKDSKTKKRPVLRKPKQKRIFYKLSEEKMEIAKIQRLIVTEELEQKLIQRNLLEKELEHKHIMHRLEKAHLLLKIKLLKKYLGKK